jgi:hypothetical protein
MRNVFVFCAAAVVSGALLAGSAWGGGDKVDIAKLPKPVVDAVKAKWPKGELKRATVEKVDGKDVYEIVVNLSKSSHIHAVVAGEGKLLEIHHHMDLKDLPAKVTDAIKAKYPKGTIDEAEKQTDPNDKVLRYEVIVELDANTSVTMLIDPMGKIEKETKETTKKDDKK